MEAVRRLREFFFPERGALRPAPYAVVALAGMAVGIAAAVSDLGQRLEWTLYDRLTQLASRGAAPAPGIVVVAIDELSFAEIGVQWPWPRSLHAKLCEELARAGARTVVVDLLFDVPSDPEEDARLAASVRQTGRVILASDLAAIVDRQYDVAQWADPIPALADAAAGLGVVRITYDPDGVLRRTPLAIEGRPTLALSAARTWPGFEEPRDLEAPRLIRFNGPPRRGILTVSYYQALESATHLPANIFRDKIVLIGRSLTASTIDELPDHYETPVAIRMSGVEVHANLLDMLLRRRLIADPFPGGAPLFLLLIVVGGLAGATFYRVSPAKAFFALLVLVGVALVTGYVALGRGDLRLPVIAPLVTTASVYASAASYRFALLSRERRLIKRAFQHYVAPAIVEQMLSDPSRLSLGGEQYDVTVLFTDLEGFTTLAERRSPEALRRHLSEYFTAMMELLLAEHATLDKFIGDAIMVYFGCPIRDAQHASQACRAALAMQRRMTTLNDQWKAAGLAELRTRIGINTGTVVAGNMGTDKIFNFTILGDCVNLASRLEGVNKEYGTLTIIGEDTRARVGGAFECRELDWIRVKGKEHPVSIYELAAADGALSADRRALFAHFQTGLEYYRQRLWQPAAVEFREALGLDPRDGPSRVFLNRCAMYSANPPPADWDGVHVMTTK